MNKNGQRELNRRHTNGRYVKVNITNHQGPWYMKWFINRYMKIFNITNYLRNSNENHNGISLHSCNRVEITTRV